MTMSIKPTTNPTQNLTNFTCESELLNKKLFKLFIRIRYVRKLHSFFKDNPG